MLTSPPPARKRVLVTGASGAIGHATCLELAGRGHRVAGTSRARGGQSAERLAALAARGVQLVEMDVTDEASVQAGVAAAAEGLGGLDVVFNNAGVGAYGVQELFSADELRRLYDVNVFGVQRVMRAVLPIFRAQGAGTVVYTSSLIGRVAVPFYGAYCASKWALEAMAQAYRAELARFGIDSFIVEPGALPTAFLDGMIQPAHADAAYAPEAAGLGPSLDGLVQMLLANGAQRPELVATRVADLLDAPLGERPFRVVADRTGMGDLIDPYNAQLAQVTHSLYAAFGHSAMLRLNAEGT
jgi:NAD(P)-dependent dehydrogenase (short-subunit alcohol dehydrogenase family)